MIRPSRFLACTEWFHSYEGPVTRSLRPLIIIEVILIATAVFLSALIVFVVLSKNGSSAEDAIDLVHASTSPTIPAASLDITTPTRMTILVPSPTATATRPALPPPLSLAEIFPPRNLLPFSLEPQHLRTVIATGDISPARSTDALIRKHKDDFAYIVSETKDVLASGDLTVINLEAPLIKDCPLHTSGLKLCGRPGFVDALTSAGIDVVTLENNHIGNYGDPGLTETKLSLESAKLTWVDRNSPATVNVRAGGDNVALTRLVAKGRAKQVGHLAPLPAKAWRGPSAQPGWPAPAHRP